MKVQMSKKVKIYRLLKKNNKLTIIETDFLKQLYSLYNTGKHKLISKKQHNWADKLLSK